MSSVHGDGVQGCKLSSDSLVETRKRGRKSIKSECTESSGSPGQHTWLSGIGGGSLLK